MFAGQSEATSQIKAVVFDAVGTLMYPSPSVASAYQEAISRHCGVSVASDVVQQTIGTALQSRSDSDDLTTNEDAEKTFWADLIHSLCPSSNNFQACFDELFIHFGLAKNWRCFDDVAGLVVHLQDMGLKVAIASNFDRRLNSVCDGLEELQSVDCRIVSSVVGYRKPAPEFFNAVVAELGVDAENILMVGDDILNDVQGAVAAGFQAALIDRTGKTTKAEVPAIVQIFSSLTKLRPWIAQSQDIRKARN